MACYVVGHLHANDASAAYAFHHVHAQANQNLRTRSEDEIREIAENGFMYGARKCSGASIVGDPVGGALVGLCYGFLDEMLGVWELGGLCVDEDIDHDVVWVLAGLALATTIVAGQALEAGLSVVANVVVSNQAPLNLLKGMGFKKRGTFERDGRQLEQYEFGIDGLHRLHHWFDRLRTRPSNGATIAVELVLGWTLDDLQSYLPRYGSFESLGEQQSNARERPEPRRSWTAPSALGALGEQLVRALRRLLSW